MNIIWKRPDGTVAVTHLTDEAVSPEHEAEKLKARGDVPADWECVCLGAELPTDRHFRDAWAWLDDQPVVNICPVRAKEVTEARLRQEREIPFFQADLAFQFAMEEQDPAKREAKLAAVFAEKKRLRDITRLVDTVPHGDLDALRTLKV